MSYTAPAGNQVDFDFTGAYTAPAGDVVDFNFVDSSAFEVTVSPTLPELATAVTFDHIQPVDLTVAAQLPALKADISLYQDLARDLTINTTLPALAPAIELERGNALTIAATLPALGSSVQLQWGVTVPGATLTSGAQDTSSGYRWGSAACADSTTEAPHNDAPPKQSATAGHWQDGDHHNADPIVPYGTLPQFDTATQVRFGDFTQWMDRNTELPENYPLPTDLDRSEPWADFLRRPDVGRSEDWNYAPPVDVDSLYEFQRVDDWGEKLVWDSRDYTPPARYAVDFDFTEPYTPPAATALDFIWGAPSPYGNQPIRPTEAGQTIAHAAPPAIDGEWEVNWGAGSWTRPLPDYVATPGWNNEQEPPADRPPQPQIREVYIFMPTLTIYRTPDGAEIEATNVTWSTDADSWAWRFSATLKRQSDLALLKPDSNGPREIACEINGHLFTGMVRGYSPSRQFGQTDINISGTSQSGWLSDPYAPSRSQLITAPYSAQQLAALELQNTGWTLDWQTQDWNLPAGAYTYENLTPISAIKRIADAVGAIVQSHQSDQTLIVKPRYPVSPHKWTDPTTALDAILPADLIQQISADYSAKPVYNRAIVAGGATGGVIVTVTRDGTAGDVLAPQITDDLITAQYAGYERGRIEIAQGGAWEQMNFTTVLTQSGSAPGLLLPGYLVEIQDTTETYPVQIAGVSINAQSSDTELKVRQTLTADRSVTNA